MIKVGQLKLLVVVGSFVAQGTVLAADFALSQAEAQRFSVDLIADGLSSPWAVEQLPEGDQVLITEKQGSLKRVNLDSGEVTEISGVAPVKVMGQGGFMDVALAPDFADSQRLYFTYAKAVGASEAATTLATALLDGDELRDWQDLLVTESAADRRQHFGSRIAFDDDGWLYFSIGDRGHRPNGQNTATHAGSILRVSAEGLPAEDNPSVGGSDALPEIYSFGHRNPQGLFFDRKRQVLFSNEHGPRGGDEINVVETGVNYGWPVISYGKEYWGPVAVGEGTERAGMAQPLYQFTPSIAPSSLIVYQGELFPEWRGQLLSGALKLQHLNVIELNEAGEVVGEQRYFESAGERIRDLHELVNGELLLLTDSGKLLRVGALN